MGLFDYNVFHFVCRAAQNTKVGKNKNEQHFTVIQTTSKPGAYFSPASGIT